MLSTDVNPICVVMIKTVNLHKTLQLCNITVLQFCHQQEGLATCHGNVCDALCRVMLTVSGTFH